jgi:hypothetical protein
MLLETFYERSELFRKKNYKAKAVLTDIYIDTTTITQDKVVILMIKPWIEKFFQNKKPLWDDTNSQNGSDDLITQSRTRLSLFLKLWVPIWWRWSESNRCLKGIGMTFFLYSYFTAPVVCSRQTTG